VKARDARPGEPTVQYLVEKPPIPIVWLDTWVISNIAKAVVGEIKGDDAAVYLRLLRILEQLRDRVAVICPETGQAAELQTKGPSAEKAPGILTRVSGGVKTHFQHVIDQQVYRAMRGYVAKAETIQLPWPDVFIDDPIAELREKRLLIRVDLGLDDDRRDLIQQKQELRAQLEGIRLRNEQGKGSVQDRFSRQLDVELAGIADASVTAFVEHMAKVMSGTATADDYLTAIGVFGLRMSALDRYSEEASGVRAGLEGLLRFYYSPYYRSLPSTKIIAAMYGFKLTRPDEAAKTGDARDIEQIAAIMPYATYVVVDNAMRNVLTSQKLDKEHSVDLVKVPDLIERLSPLLASRHSRRASARRRH
jgi:hypothetical protein